jgi:hypothetical protein
MLTLHFSLSLVCIICSDILSSSSLSRYTYHLSVFTANHTFRINHHELRLGKAKADHQEVLGRRQKATQSGRSDHEREAWLQQIVRRHVATCDEGHD